MKNQTLRVERTLHAQTSDTSRMLLACAMALCLLLCATQRLAAQTYLYDDLTQYAHGVAMGAGGPWSAGDTVPVTFSLGDVNAPVQHLAGVQLKVTLGSGVTVPASGAVSVSGSWCFDPATVSIACSTAGQPLELSTTVMHPTGSCASGYGDLLTLHIVTPNDDPKLADLVDGVGGLVIIENVDARQAAPRPGASPWPNPTAGQLQLPGAPAQAMVQVMPLAGGAWSAALPLQPAAQGAAVDLGQLPPGCYLLRVQAPGAAPRYHRVIRE